MELDTPPTKQHFPPNDPTLRLVDARLRLHLVVRPGLSHHLLATKTLAGPPGSMTMRSDISGALLRALQNQGGGLAFVKQGSPRRGLVRSEKRDISRNEPSVGKLNGIF
jgi:hypothetical protein